MLPGWGVGGMFGGGGPMMIPRHRFEEQYHVYSVAVADKAHLEVCTCVSRMVANAVRMDWTGLSNTQIRTIERG